MKKSVGVIAALTVFSVSALFPLASSAADLDIRVGGGRGVAIGVDVGRPPPPMRYEALPPQRDGYIWVPGYWTWAGQQHVWVEGRWERERPGYAYVPGRWEQRGERWHYEPERWEEHRREEAYRDQERHEEHRYREERRDEHRREEWRDRDGR